MTNQLPRVSIPLVDLEFAASDVDADLVECPVYRSDILTVSDCQLPCEVLYRK